MRVSHPRGDSGSADTITECVSPATVMLEGMHDFVCLWGASDAKEGMHNAKKGRHAFSVMSQGSDATEHAQGPQ